ncbi:aminodeoxychorismate synthase component I [Microbacterium terricola]|uniref:Chorismate-utilising enzyme C-terminal domain-containing protein n=1 Tax=Microbacterium terricola TaxID=344163 RepID=A0ABM8DYG9_9MICO|nr:aminodeoxychorismate synthase component I [Microbacterium terricola]UYK41482.1 aminodeoxychorismate synthase component I [Microbacterium terricola]BDV30728.1 hypothetical protein Microterr_13880 [Microbacterium terricola]
MSEPFVAVPADGWIDPARAFALAAASDAGAFWLDAGPDATTGWSWLGTGSRESDSAPVRAVPCAGDGDAPESGPFRSGRVGWFGYEPDADLWLRVDWMLSFDHVRRRVWLLAPARAAASLLRALAALPTAPREPGSAPEQATAVARHSPERYAAMVQECRAAIRAGDAYQLCLTTRFAIDGGIDPVETYLRLRRATPAHHGGLIVAGDTALISASPERFLQVESGIVRTSPIKGTRPRGVDSADDAAQVEDLVGSVKERAENVMIVDLMRNDLSRVCEPGSVGVDALLAVETYPAVHQLVSTVSGRLRPDTTVGDLIDATFPAGSMTGAPKISAMSIVQGLEGAPRGVYSGCFGWVSDDGALDLAMVIRSIVAHEDGAYVGAGGGITWLSDPAAEVDEVALKARAPLAAAGAALPPGWAAGVR